jgi:hypothetical protein
MTQLLKSNCGFRNAVERTVTLGLSARRDLASTRERQLAAR